MKIKCPHCESSNTAELNVPILIEYIGGSGHITEVKRFVFNCLNCGENFVSIISFFDGKPSVVKYEYTIYFWNGYDMIEKEISSPDIVLGDL
jgi:hypothetical protein